VPSCQEAGVLGVIAGIIGVIQATEVIKLVLGKGNLLNGKLLLYDSLNMDFKKLNIHRNPACPMCGENPTIKELIDYEEFCQVNF
jgi:adenylyltransferase/sulfurtransferase